MKRVLKWAGYGLAGVVVFVLFAAAGAFTASEVMIRRPVGSDDVKLISASAGSVDRGARVAKLNGCHDCHGAQMEGKLFHDDPKILKAWGPNLTLAVAEQSDAELDRAIRHGVGLGDRPLWVMPSYALSQLSDQEAADLIAYLRTFPATGAEQPDIQVGPVGRMGVLMGKLQSEAKLVRVNGPMRLPELGAQHQSGREVARLCVECHGADLKGNPMLKSPDLTMVGSYDGEDFRRLMHEGVATGDRPLKGLMGEVARTRFSALSEAEIAALHGYLKARADRQISAAQ